MIDLAENTKLKDVLAEAPGLKSRLAEANPMFSRLSTPIGKIMINKVTLSDMAQRSGMEPGDLISKLNALIAEERR